MKYGVALTDVGSQVTRAAILASYLIEHLGADLTAYLTGLAEPAQVEHWAGESWSLGRYLWAGSVPAMRPSSQS